jgi:hypothetical protein
VVLELPLDRNQIVVEQVEDLFRRHDGRCAQIVPPLPVYFPEPR